MTHNHRKEAHLGLEPLGFLAHSLANSYQVLTYYPFEVGSDVRSYVVYATQVTIKKYLPTVLP